MFEFVRFNGRSWRVVIQVVRFVFGHISGRLLAERHRSTMRKTKGEQLSSLLTSLLIIPLRWLTAMWQSPTPFERSNIIIKEKVGSVMQIDDTSSAIWSNIEYNGEQESVQVRDRNFEISSHANFPGDLFKKWVSAKHRHRHSPIYCFRQCSLCSTPWLHKPLTRAESLSKLAINIFKAAISTTRLARYEHLDHRTKYSIAYCCQLVLLFPFCTGGVICRLISKATSKTNREFN